ncbi:TetR family transcriptional regulator [Paenibacillus sp. FSL H7-0756]
MTKFSSLISWESFSLCFVIILGSGIADELSITHAALYKHFKNKQELWAA